VAWTGPATLALTAPPGSGWTAVIDLVARRSDGSESAWTVDTAVSGETASYEVAPPPGASGMVLLSGRVTFENSDGSVLRSRRLGGAFVAARAGRYEASPERFTGAVGVGLVQDPHDALVVDEEVTR
jgi:hypothetical protein